MTPEKIFKDTIFTNCIMKYGNDCFGYIVHNGYSLHIYNNYMSVSKFKEFKEEMMVSHLKAYDEYIKGSGQELFPKDTAPPKMACFASSSRFCYKALSDGEFYFNTVPDNWSFEKPCPIFYISDKDTTKKPSQPPHLDAYLQGQNIYIEAKCQEIFNDHTTKLKKAYWEYIASKRKIDIKDKTYNIGFNLSFTIPKPTASEFDIPYKEFGITLKETSIRGKKIYLRYFDFKQFLCHLLGIACENIKKGVVDKKEKATLCYMFFKPLSDNKDTNLILDNLFKELEAEINEVFNNQHIKNFCEENNIKLRAIAEEAKVMEKLGDLKTLPSQDNSNNVVVLFKTT